MLTQCLPIASKRNSSRTPANEISPNQVVAKPTTGACPASNTNKYWAQTPTAKPRNKYPWSMGGSPAQLALAYSDLSFSGLSSHDDLPTMHVRILSRHKDIYPLSFLVGSQPETLVSEYYQVGTNFLANIQISKTSSRKRLRFPDHVRCKILVAYGSWRIIG